MDLRSQEYVKARFAGGDLKGPATMQ